ncbi:DUF6204 family protein [Streptomyces sp. NPDC020858]|uniref:DUF6204 family protein n=1 Tax=Streptomyces sp. NPDC020858 TaxID=3365097 RepID=UPI0037A79F78
MSTRTFRITVRGSFDGLTDDQRAELLAAAPAHDMLRAEFTAAGHLTYDLAVRPFFKRQRREAARADARP